LVTEQKKVPYVMRRLGSHVSGLTLGVANRLPETRAALRGLKVATADQLPALVFMPPGDGVAAILYDGISTFPAIKGWVTLQMNSKHKPPLADDDSTKEEAATTESSDEEAAESTSDSDDTSDEEAAAEEDVAPPPPPVEEHDGTEQGRLFVEMANQVDAHLQVDSAWSSNTKKGITAKDWEVSILDTYTRHRLDLVPTVARTAMRFDQIDLDGSGRVTRREFDEWYSAMKIMPEMLLEKLQKQHGFSKGDTVRWVGKYDAPWRGGATTKVLQIGRDLRGQALAIVESEGDVGPNVTDNSFSANYQGRRVKINDIELVMAGNGNGTSPAQKAAAPITQADLSAEKIFYTLKERLDTVEVEEEEDEISKDVMHPMEVEALLLDRLLPLAKKAEWQQYGLSKEIFLELFHQYRFQGELLRIVLSTRDDTLRQMSETTVGTTCAGTKYCLCPQDIINLGHSPTDLVELSAEFRRFGRVTLEKKIGFANTWAILTAMRKRRDERIKDPESIRRVEHVPTPFERLQLAARVIEVMASPLREPTQDVYERAWGFPLSAGVGYEGATILHETNRKNKVTAIALLTSTQKVRFTCAPSVENQAWLSFLRGAERMGRVSAIDESGVAYNASAWNVTSLAMLPDEIVLRTTYGKVKDLVDGGSGSGYVSVLHQASTGRLRVAIRALVRLP